MNTKPQLLCELERDKSIYSARSFVDTFNWLKSCLDRLRGEKGIKIEGLEDGDPVISIDVDSDDLSGKVTITGTDGSSAEGSDFVFESAEDSNVEIKVEPEVEQDGATGAESETGRVKIVVGVYWK